MRPTAAEIARTLARGRIGATAHIACRPGPWTVRQATDCTGAPLLLVRAGDALEAALRPRPGSDDVAVAVCVEDEPPLPGAPGHGRVWVSGWASKVEGDARRRTAAIEFAEVNPVEELLDLDHGIDLYRVDVAEVRLESGGTMRSVDPEEYTAADPDPLHDLEADLLVDLAEHHGPQIQPYLASRLVELGFASRPGRTPQAVRLDRYGFLVAPYTRTGGLGGHFVRLPFAQPVNHSSDLARVMHPVLFPRTGDA